LIVVRFGAEQNFLLDIECCAANGCRRPNRHLSEIRPLNLLAEPEALHPLKPYKTLSNDQLCTRISAVRREMGDRLMVLGHHYQQDEVIEHADLRGDSYQLSQMAAASASCEAIVFCGVHFMAETADILANRPEKLAERDGRRVTVVLPDMAAGCSMADMAAINQVEAAWADMAEVIDTERVIPVTYINSAASLKAFCGRHGGIVCTSSNAAAVLKWAFQRGDRVFFFPDQHLGRNTALTMGITEDQMPVWDPYAVDLGGNSEQALEASRVILWKGHCSVHQMFRAEHVNQFRQQHPGIKILVHPECPREVNDLADVSGSTGKIIETVKQSPAGTKWAIGTELHLVNRLKQEHPEQEIHFLSPVVCMCATMYRIDLPHLCWSLENLRDGSPVNVIQVSDEVTHWSLVALERMLAVK
jgi:quinolinate synthase